MKNYLKNALLPVLFIFSIAQVMAQPVAVKIYNTGGGNTQLTFNNAGISTTQPVFRVGVPSGTAPNLFSIEISPSATFAVNVTTQNFAGSYVAGTQYNLTFTNNFSPAAGTTYYVRSRASANGGANYGNYSAGTFSFTYKASGVANWFQTTQAQFQTNTLSNITAGSNGEVHTTTGGGGANPFSDPSFEDGQTWFFNTCCANGGQLATLSSDDAFVTAGNNCLAMYNDDPGSWGYLPNDFISTHQEVNLTGVNSITFDLSFWNFAWNNFGCDNVFPCKFRVIIGNAGTGADLTGTEVYTFTPNAPTCMNYVNKPNQVIDLSGLGLTGTKTVKIVNFTYQQYFPITLAEQQMRFYVDNIRTASGSVPGVVTSTPITLSSVKNATGWKSLNWNQTLSGGAITLKIQKFTGGAWADAAGFTSISSVTDGNNTFDISTLTADSIKVVATITGTTSPLLNEWSADVFAIEETPCVPLNITATPTSATCGKDNGAIAVTVSEGTEPYTYSWSNGSSLEDISDLGADTYTVTVTDNNGCSSSQSAIVGNIAGPTASATGTNGTCGNDNGSITLTVNGGTAPFTYLWNNGATTKDISGIGEGGYSVSVTDDNGCSVEAGTGIGTSTGLTADAVPTNTTCAFNNGSIALTVSGGTEPYTYSWNSDDTAEDISNLSPFNYTVTVTDANGCSGTAEATIGSSVGITATPTAGNASCGLENGTITLDVSGGTEPYAFAWSNEATTQNVSDLAPDTYSVTVTDDAECSTVAEATISSISLMNLTLTPADASCSGSDGQIELTVNGGSPNYTYSWSNGSTLEDQSFIGAGTYTVTVTDSKGCTATDGATIEAPVNTLIADATATATSCGYANGSVSVTVSGGTEPYTYSWSNSVTTKELTNVSPGTYNIIITDAIGCTTLTGDIVNISNAVTIQVLEENAATCGSNNGSVAISVSLGAEPYTYSWSNEATTQNISGLAADNYNVTVTDATGCTGTAEATIESGSGFTVSATTTSATCGLENGAIQLTVSGGEEPYTYAWVNDETTQNISNIFSNSYPVTITDQNGCSKDTTIDVPGTNFISLEPIVSDATCGQENGSISVLVDGGNFDYTYSWTNSATTSAELSNLGAGIYSVTVTDSDGCSASIEDTINSGGSLTITPEVTDASCGNENGAITVTVSGGTEPYTYNWSNASTTGGGGNGDAEGFWTETFGVAGDNTSANSYVSGNGTWVVTNTGTNDNASNLWFISNTECGGVVGTCGAECSSGGTASLHISASGLTLAGALGCTGGDCGALYDAGGIFGAAGTSKRAESPAIDCSGKSNITLAFNYIEGGNGTDNGTVWYFDGTDWSQLSDPGKTTNTGCASGKGKWTAYSVSLPVSANNNANVKIGFRWVNNNDGVGTDPSFAIDSITLTGEGSGPVEQTNSASDLAGGTYTVTVTDQNGCSSVKEIEVDQTGKPEIVISGHDGTCSEAASITITVSGGAEPYTYSWSNGATTQNIENLESNEYSVTVTDATGCSATNSTDVEVNSGVSADISGTNTTCGQPNGTVTLFELSGTEPLTFAWSNEATTQNIEGLEAGTYTVTITDANECSVVLEKTLENVNELGIELSIEDASCGLDNGNITVSPSGGVEPYTYEWSNAGTDGGGTPAIFWTENFENACEAGCDLGTYLTGPNGEWAQVNIGSQDNTPNQWFVSGIYCRESGGNCSISCGTESNSLHISNSAIPDFGVSADLGGYNSGGSCDEFDICVKTDRRAESPVIDCSGKSNIKLDFIYLEGGQGTTDNGTVWYYDGTDWSQVGDPDKTASCDFGASQWTDFSVTLPSSANNNPNVKIGFRWVNNDDGLGDDPSFAIDSVTLTGESAGGGGTQGNSMENLEAGTYSVTVKDANGCSASTEITIEQSGSPEASATPTAASCGLDNGSIAVTVTGGTEPYTYNWSNEATTKDIDGLATGDYTLIVTDKNGCSDTTSAEIGAGGGITASIAFAGGTHCGLNNGIINIEVTGGADYTYLWSNEATTQNIEGLEPGTYTVTVSAAGGCTDTAVAVINESTNTIVLDASSTPENCGQGNGTATVNVSNAPPPYAYSWSNEATTQSLEGLSADTFTVTVTDDFGCTAVTSTIVTNTPSPVITAGAKTICNGESTELTVTGSDNYTWLPETALSATNGATVTANPTATITYTITATDGNNCSSETTVVVTVNNTPAAPLATAATAIGSSTLKVNWGAASGATAYLLDVSADIAFGSFVSGFENLNVGNVTSKVVTGLTSGTKYYYRVRATNTCGTSDNSNTITATTTVAAPCSDLTGGIVTPAEVIVCPDGDVLLTNAGYSDGTLQWQVSADNISWEDISGATDNTYEATGISVKKYFRAVLKTTSCFDVASSTAIVNVSATPVVTVKTITSNSVTITWSPYGSGQYNISWDGTAGSGSENGVTTNTYTITSLASNADIQVSVTLANPSCSGTNAGIAKAHTLCGTPNVIAVTAGDAPAKAFKVQWDAVNGATAYRVYYRNLLSSGTWSFVDTTGTNKTIKVPFGGQTYAVYVVTKDCPAVGKQGEPSQTYFVTTNPPSTCTPAPTVTAISNCPNQVSVTVTGGNGNYALTLRRIAPSVTSPITVNVNGSTMNITIGSQYAGSVWEVFARTNCGGGSFSDLSNVAMVVIKPSCPPASNLVISHVNCKGFTASWNTNDCLGLGVNSYSLLIKKTGTANYNSNPAGTSNFKEVTWLTPGSYDVTVLTVACNGAPSSYSQVLTVTVGACREGEEGNVADVAVSDSKESLVVYPNPSNGQFFLDLALPNNSEELVKIELVNQLGQVVQTNLSQATGGHLSQTITAPNEIASGVYYIRTFVGSNVYVTKMVIEKQ